MKILGKFLLSVVFLVLLLLGLITTSFKFQLLTSDFWTQSFQKADVYSELTSELKTAVEQKVQEGGGSVNSARFVTDLINEDNIQITVEKNITNFLAFANGKAKDIVVYLPLDSLPTGYIPKNLSLNQETPLKTILAMYGGGSTNVSYFYIASLGRLTNAVWLISLILLLLVIFIMYSANPPGKKFVHLGLTLVVDSFLVLVLAALIYVVQTTVPKDLISQGSEPAQVLLGTIAPPLLVGIVTLWAKIVASLGVIGVVLLFVKRPDLARKRKNK